MLKINQFPPQSPPLVDHPTGMTNDPKMKAMIDALMGQGDGGVGMAGAIPSALSAGGIEGMSPLVSAMKGGGDSFDLDALSPAKKFDLLKMLGG